MEIASDGISGRYVDSMVTVGKNSLQFNEIASLVKTTATMNVYYFINVRPTPLKRYRMIFVPVRMVYGSAAHRYILNQIWTDDFDY